MGLFGDLVTGALGGFGSKPTVPRFTPIDVGAEAKKAISENIANLPQAEQLVSQANLFNQQEIQRMMQQAIPGFSNITGSISKNIASEVAGQIPKDVSEQVQLSDAARALAGGYSGAGMHGNLVARDLGLTSLQLTQQGLSSAESWMATMNQLFQPGQINTASMFVSPQFQTQVDIQQQEEAFNVQWLKNQLAAMPDPETAAIARDVGQLASVATFDWVPGMIPGMVQGAGSAMLNRYGGGAAAGTAAAGSGGSSGGYGY